MSLGHSFDNCLNKHYCKWLSDSDDECILVCLRFRFALTIFVKHCSTVNDTRTINDATTINYTTTINDA